MGMTCTLRRVPSTDIDLLVKDPATVRRILFADEENWTLTKPKGLTGFLLRFTPISIETATPKQPLSDADWNSLKEVECDLEGAWHGLHFLFTGTAWEGDEPACYLVRGGDEIGDDDFDLPPRILRPERVRGFNDFLGGLSDDDLRGRYNPQRMVDLNIEPSSLWLDSSVPNDLGLERLLESFSELRAFTEGAAAVGDGLIVHLG